jgi:hypothetical protein
MAAHRQDLRDQRHAQARRALGGRDRGAQAGAACANDDDVRLDDLHQRFVSVTSW